MSDISQRLRELFDSIAPPIDVEHLDGARLPIPRRWAGWQIGLVSGVAVALLVGSGLVWLSGRSSDPAMSIPAVLDRATGEVWQRTTAFQRDIIGDGDVTFLELQASMAAVVNCIRESGDWFVGGEVLETGEHSITVADATGVGDPPTGPTSQAAVDEAQTRCMREYFDDVLLVYLDRGEPHIRVILSDDTTDDELAQAVADVFALGGVTFARGISREAAFAEFSELFAECEELVEVARQDLSMFSIVINVWVDVDADIGDNTEVVDVANRVLTAMTVGGYGLVDINLTTPMPIGQTDCLIPTDSPTTTLAPLTELEPAGVQLVEEITADGYVSRDEFISAVEGMASCMTDHGLTGVSWSVDEVGNGWSIDHESPTGGSAETAIYTLCLYSYIPDESFRVPPLPYLGLELAGWEFWHASESEAYCSDEPAAMPGASRSVTYTYGLVGPEDHPLFVGVSSVSIQVRPASTRCSFQDEPANASDLGPPADPPFVIDHGMTTVMGREARIVEEQGTFSVLWLVDDHGSTASMYVFPRDTDLNLSDVLEIAAGIVELTPEEWAALLTATPESPPVTTP